MFDEFRDLICIGHPLDEKVQYCTGNVKMFMVRPKGYYYIFLVHHCTVICIITFDNDQSRSFKVVEISAYASDVLTVQKDIKCKIILNMAMLSKWTICFSCLSKRIIFCFTYQFLL